MKYDVVIIHPPAAYDFRKQSVFTGPISFTVPESSDQFIVPPTGILSIADYLDRHGYKVIVDNIGERMVTSNSFDAEKHIRGYESKVFAIELQWVRHAQGAIEIARLCKQLHPEALVVMGGVTATIFHEEIIEKFPFIDIVIRAEAEIPFLRLMDALKENRLLDDVPNLTYRDNKGIVRVNYIMEPGTDLDEFEFTRFDLLEPKKAIFATDWPSHWALPVCRGCTQNCVSCGGSAYSYRTYFGRNKPAFRSPQKIIDDLYKAAEQGIQLVYLYQDPRIGGREYWKSLLEKLQHADIPIKQITMQLFGPADEEYIKELSKVRIPVALTTSPESGVDSVRKAHNKNYTNEEMFKSLEICKKYNITVDVFTMVALANDTPDTIKETWKMWEELCEKNSGENGKVASLYPYSFGPMILMDPGSLAFDFPGKYGYRTSLENLEDYIKAQMLPSWHQWISYETRYLDKKEITGLILDSIEYSIKLREKYGLYSKSEAEKYLAYFVDESKEIIDMINRVMSYYDDTDDEQTG
jgi:B12-binding domain/radical SAM domain protein